MKLISYRHQGRDSFGAVVAGGIVELLRRLPMEYSTIPGLLEGAGLERAREIAGRLTADLGLDEIEYLHPVPQCEKIVCIGINYRDRNEEYKDGSAAQNYPSVFMRTRESLSAHLQPIFLPAESSQLDYEGEIALVIGKPGRRIPESQAPLHVAGITCMNEGTIRDWLRHGKHNVTQGKNFDRTGSIGPWLVTSDELSPFGRVRLTTRVNGEVRQDDTTDNLVFDFRYLIGYLSTFMTLKPGDVIATGTPTGAGARSDPPRYLRPGDVLEVEVSGVGTLVNTVVEE